MSVPSPSEQQATFAATLVDEWIRHGLREVVVCPGSRSTPIVLAVAARAELTVHVRLDERSAGFFALGCTKRTGRPTVIVVTSGTAAAELHAAVAEADHAREPLVVVTADRPAELHGVGAPQTMDQGNLFGGSVRLFEEPGVARSEAAASWRPLASRLYRTAQQRRGPVHLNAAFVEPLVAAPTPLPVGRVHDAPWITEVEAAPSPVPISAARVLVVTGPGSDLVFDELSAWTVVADVTTRGTVAHFDAFLRDDVVAAMLRPDVVVRSGAMPASKILQERLAQWDVPVVAVSSADVSDPGGLVHELRRLAPGTRGSLVRTVTRDDAFEARWRDAQSAVDDMATQLDDDAVQLSEPTLARSVTAWGRAVGVPIFVGSSMPVRDVEWWSSGVDVPVMANRGVNGIDGVTSSALGAACGARAIALVGDITFLHDVSALTDGLGPVGGSCALVVADNGGGGIFSFLAQGDLVDEQVFAQYFATPREHDFVAIATGFGHRASRVETNGDLRDALREALDHDGVTVIVARVPHHRDNVELHAELNALAANSARDRLS